MRQVWITKSGGPEVLQVREAPDPEVGAGQVRIRVQAAGINFADLSARLGLYPDAPKPPCVVGYEVSGTIDAIGEGATGFKIGDRVFGMPKFGGYTDVIVLNANQVHHMPTAMSFEEAAAFPVVYLTAHHIMLFIGHLRPGSSVFIHSIAGGVGLAAIQIAKTRGCTIFGTASPSKHAFLKERGVHHPIDSSADYVAETRAIVGDRGIDLILDPVGAKSWTRGFELLGPCGRLAAFGMSAATPGTTRNLFHAAGQLMRVKKWSPMKMMDDNKTVSGTNMGHLFSRLDLLTPQFESLLAMYERKEVAPHVDKSFPFAEAAAAHQYIHDRKAVGKVVLTP